MARTKQDVQIEVKDGDGHWQPVTTDKPVTDKRTAQVALKAAENIEGEYRIIAVLDSGKVASATKVVRTLESAK